MSLCGVSLAPIFTQRPPEAVSVSNCNKMTTVIFCWGVCGGGVVLTSVTCVQGGVILVSHDERLIRSVCKELWVCEGGKVRRIDGGFDEYRDILHEQFKKEGYL